VQPIYEQRLRQVLDVVQRYLPPDGIGLHDAMSEINGLVDPWPGDTPLARQEPKPDAVYPVQPSSEAATALDAWYGGSSMDASMLRNLLAVIHGDGGHYVAQHGIEKAAEDAEKLVAERFAASLSSTPAQGDGEPNAPRGVEQTEPFWCHEQSHDRARCDAQCAECAEYDVPATVKDYLTDGVSMDGQPMGDPHPADVHASGVALPREPQPVADVILVSGKVASCRERAGHGLPDGPHALYAAAGVGATADYCATDGTCSCRKFSADPTNCGRRKELAAGVGASDSKTQAPKGPDHG
jgi:hypothetical protein